jgi:hypothetical protein
VVVVRRCQALAGVHRGRSCRRRRISDERAILQYDAPQPNTSGGVRMGASIATTRRIWQSLAPVRAPTRPKHQTTFAPAATAASAWSCRSRGRIRGAVDVHLHPCGSSTYRAR